MIDSHFHIWSLQRGDYGWLTPGLRPIYRDISADDWRQQAHPCGVKSGILVQAAPTEAEAWFGWVQNQHHFTLVRHDGATRSVEVDGTHVEVDGKPVFQFFVRELTGRRKLFFGGKTRKPAEFVT